MQLFEIDSNNNIIFVSDRRDDSADLEYFGSEAELLKISKKWAGGRLVEIWNSFAGAPPFGDLKPVAKFENREKAAKRIWSAVQKLATEPAAPGKPARAEGRDTANAAEARDTVAAKGKREATPKVAAKGKREATPKVAAKGKREATPKADGAPNKREQAIAMIQRPGGAKLQDLMDSFGWQAHTTRGFVATLGTKHGLKIESLKTDAGERAYRILGG